MDPITIYACVTAMIWGACNRFWGEDDASDHISKVVAAIFIGVITAEFVILAGFKPWQGLAAFFACGVGFWLGRVQDGVRGTFTEKSHRGWKYCGIYVCMAFALQNPVLLLPALFFWQSGAIHSFFYTKGAGKWDYVPVAEFVDGTFRGALVVIAIMLAA